MGSLLCARRFIHSGFFTSTHGSSRVEVPATRVGRRKLRWTGRLLAAPRAMGRSRACPEPLDPKLVRLTSTLLPASSPTACPPRRRRPDGERTGDAGAPSRCSWCQVPFEECAWTFLCVPPAAAGSCLAALVWRVDLLAVHSFPFGGTEQKRGRWLCMAPPCAACWAPTSLQCWAVHSRCWE